MQSAKKQTKTYKRYEPKKVTDYTVNTFFAVSGSPAWGSYYAFIGFIGSYAVLYCLFSRLFYGCLVFFARFCSSEARTRTQTQHRKQ